VTRRQLQRALAARDAARAEVRRLRGALADAERAAQTQHDIAGVWRSAALQRAAERDAALAQLAHRSGARIEARTTRDGDLAEVCLVGLDAVTIADLAQAIARGGSQA